MKVRDATARTISTVKGLTPRATHVPPARRHRSGRLGPLIAGGTIGALLAYFLDRERGRARRLQAADRLRGLVRSSGVELDRVGRRVNAQTTGLRQRVIQLRSGRLRLPGTPASNEAEVRQTSA